MRGGPSGRGGGGGGAGGQVRPVGEDGAGILGAGYGRGWWEFDFEVDEEGAGGCRGRSRVAADSMAPPPRARTQALIGDEARNGCMLLSAEGCFAVAGEMSVDFHAGLGFDHVVGVDERQPRRAATRGPTVVLPEPMNR